MVDKWLHLTGLGGDPWILPIWSAVNAAVKANRIHQLPADNVYQLGLHISTRLNILPCITRRLNKEIKALFKYAKKHKSEHEFTKYQEGYAFPDPGCPHYKKIDALKYNLIVDIDSFLFELNSLCELMTDLFGRLYLHAGENMPKTNAGLSMKMIIEKSGKDASWFSELDEHRNIFIHKACPYIAIDISNPDKYDLLIMKENIKKFDDPNKFIRLSVLSNIACGFIDSKIIIQNHLISLFEP